MTAPTAPLAPCPFCHSLKVLMSSEDGFHFGRCLGCAAHGPMRATPAAAIAAWNTRPAAATVDAELVAALEAILNINNPAPWMPGHIDLNTALQMGRSALARVAPTQPAAPGAQAKPGLEQAGQGGARGASGSSTVQE